MTQRRSGSGMWGMMAILIALLFIVGPLIVPFISGISQIILVGFGVFMLIVGSVVVTVTRLYRKTAADEAFVRTGMGGLRPIIDGGALVIPVVHQVIPVSLKTMRLDVDRGGTDALITGDNLRADVAAEFYIKVQKKQEDVIAAATSLGERSVDGEEVKKLVFQKLVSALRTVAATRSLKELHTKRDDFASAVQMIVEKDLAPNGLTLESVTISRLDQTPPQTMRGETNVFDAQGLRTIAEITQKQRVDRNKIEREADQQVKTQDVERDKYIFSQDISLSEAEAAKNRDIEIAQARNTQEAQTFAAEQERMAGIAKVQKDQAIQVAEVQKNAATQVEDQRRAQAVQEAEINKQRAIEIAEREKAIAVAEKERQRAETEALRFAAEKEREREKQQVLTVEVTQTAERAKAQTVINEQAQIERQRLREQMEADVKAYAEMKRADAQAIAAEKQAVARLTLADAEKKAQILSAEGLRATQMVPVEVNREQVNVEDARVEVKRKELQYQAEFETIARDLQVELARIAAEKDARIAAAAAFGDAMSRANLTLWGDPTTMQRMAESFFKGQTSGEYLSGLVQSMPEGVKEAANSAGEFFTTFGASLVERLTGKNVPAEKIAEIVKELLAAQKRS